ncbi:MAG: DUF1015 domain-containing protein [Spirochaetia bacterium]|jgi:hypothetical protein|nr:DUF1015 domain-containing protein [Spirochaetia bacterium]
MAKNDSNAMLASLGVLVPEILVPAEGVDIGSWAVIACDQYTSEPEYWDKVARVAEGKPSALHCVLPELYLGSEKAEGAIAAIQKTMGDYVASGILRPLPPGLVLVERSTPYHALRRGVMLALDMERYDYRPGTSSLIRPTEGTIVERLPPRIRIRRDAALELPHIMVLIDDRQDEALGRLFGLAAAGRPVYDGELMLGCGRVRGRFLEAGKAGPALAEALGALQKESGHPQLLFAMGDGNHSLAAAKAAWEEIRPGLSPGERERHPARHALVEIVNLYDPGVEFHPIHRVLTGADPRRFFAFLGQKPGFVLKKTSSFEETKSLCAAAWEDGDGQAFFTLGLLSAGETALLRIPRDGAALPTAAAQRLLEEFCSGGGGEGSTGGKTEGKIDYIHGGDSLFSLCAGGQALGVLLPGLPKSELFPLVLRDGTLPRKAFSIGEAPEKRFYLEARRIRDSAIPSFNLWQAEL